ncbi:MAG: metal-dependent transcriptional regulator [Desulfurococcaceae archaeon]|jgi:DtxR family Mn-dependent transcriptional regulator|nr:metal-dependent transcriptional regulator [Desulfurococcaceae archaeon]MCC6052981.1 metal-dependent transcriptional regulator [Desulfurococcaceae archaeon]
MKSQERGLRKSSYEDYLATIYRLREVYGQAKLLDVSRELGVKPSTASKILSQLEKKSLVKRYMYKEVVLTSKGIDLAIRIIRKHRIAEAFLAHKLGIDVFDTHYYAHYLEHLPDELIERIYVITGSPKICPHGNIIPIVENREESLSLEQTHYTRLSEATPGLYRVERIAGELSTILPVLKELQIKPGVMIEVVQQTPLYTAIRYDQALKEVVKHVAFTVFLKPM